MKNQVVNHFFSGSLYVGEPVIGVSMTVPGQSMPIDDLLRRYAHGIPYEVDRHMHWVEGEDEDIIFPVSPDLTDVDAMQYKVKSLQDSIEAKKKAIEAHKKAQDERKALKDKKAGSGTDEPAQRANKADEERSDEEAE